ncbi:MAG TPA: LLM class flavin-dependent oxidoreductase [Candidatus Methylomirabilis sp.]|nr:LLM class flavin-dependent oxidoreductase [Candidatus Methylomirabilis sp.]
MELGVVVDILWPLERIARVARAADEEGFDQLWLSDHPLAPDPFLTLLHLAPQLQRIRLGIGTINPSARHPAIIAASAATLNDLTGGRFWLGIGSSIPSLLNPIGFDVAGQIPRCREAVLIIRQLLEQGRSDFSGKVFTTRDARLVFGQPAPIPVLMGTSGGPEMLRISGEAAHGIIIPAGNRSFYEYAITTFRRAHAAAGRSDPTRIVLNGNIAVANTSEAAREVIRPLVADSIAHRAMNQHSLRQLGITAEQAQSWRTDPASIPDDVLQDSAIAGTPDECIEGLARFASWGISQLAMRFPEEDTVRAVGQAVLPKLRR